jgi:ligand-binding SRPBCC domain-containing protein
MTTIIKTIAINAPRETIRQFYAHPVHTPKWSPRLTLWEPEDAWPAAGSKTKMGVKSGGIKAEGIATTIAYDEATMAHHFRFVPTNLAPMDFWVTFEERGGKTTVVYKVEYTIPGSFLGQALDKLFVERQNARDIEQQLVNLKALAEGAA